jgi:hypothetical protein
MKGGINVLELCVAILIIAIAVLVTNGCKKDSVEVFFTTPLISFGFKSKNDKNSDGRQSSGKK